MHQSLELLVKLITFQLIDYNHHHSFSLHFPCFHGLDLDSKMENHFVFLEQTFTALPDVNQLLVDSYDRRNDTAGLFDYVCIYPTRRTNSNGKKNILVKM